MHEKLLTIITATYNSARTLEQTITSVLAQTVPVEYIVIDGGSTDGTVDIIKKYADRIAYWVSEPDDGIYSAFNKGVAAATGEYVAFLGSDDALAGTRAIESIVGYFEDDVDILSCQEWCVYEGLGRQDLFSNAPARDKASYRGGMIPHGAMFARRSLFTKYPFDESYRIAGDYKFFLQCYYDPSVRFRFVDEPVVFFEVTSGVSSNVVAARAEDARIYRELGLPFDDLRDRPLYKKLLLPIVDALGIGRFARQMFHAYLRGERHVCDNPICRWCHRGV